MKSIQLFLSELSQQDIKLWVEGEKLRCNAPKGALTQELKEELSKRKPEIISFLQQSSVETIKPLPRSEDLPLSFSQQRLWFLEQLEESNAIYNESSALRLEGNLNITALEESWRKIVARHEVLRTNFQTVDGKPVLTISPQPDVHLKVIDLKNTSEVEQSAEVKKLLEEEMQRPFNLEKGNLWRGILIRLADNDHILLLVMHHIICDGWSMGIFIRELSALYHALSAGIPHSLPELPIQYVDFAAWQNQWLKGAILEKQLKYWQEKLKNIPPLLELPTDHPRPSTQTFRGEKQYFIISQSLTQKLKNLSQQSDTTLFMVLLGAFAVLLSRYSRQEDILIGSPISGRNRKEIETLVGCFVNTLVLRLNTANDATFTEFLKQVRQVCLEAYAHQDIPFEKLLEGLNVERSLSHSPLFQVMFVLHNAPIEELNLPGLTLNPVELETASAKFDLTLSLEETEAGLKGFWGYNLDLFDAATISRAIGHFQQLLEAIITNPQEKIAQLTLLTEEERHQLLVEWNDTTADYPKDKCIHQLFEEQVEKTPNAVAVVYEEEQLTYQELNQKANQLARYLQKLGVKPDTLVGICVERSVEMIIGLLGILKAGGAYVPIDPNYPTERVNYMLEDSGVSVLLTQEKLRETLPQTQAQKICLDRDWLTIDQESNNNISSKVKAENLAYVIYTSGSTGKPKGVMICHKNVINLFTWHQKAFSVTAADKATQIAGTAFDASVWEIYPYLTCGTTLYLVNRESRLSPTNITTWLVANKISICFLPTPLAEAVLSLDESASLSLRTLLTGGDKLHSTELNYITFPLINNYGPTENTVVTTSGQVIESEKETNPHIGKPISNTQIYILDSNLQSVPIGVAGELHIGGDGLSKGYLNRPELTAQKFIPNPFGKGKLYKTGDLCRYLPDGNIEYIGRIDHQVKIRGFRIELGEIESVLGQHPQVREAVVIVREDQPGNKRLVAYVVAKEETPSLSELRKGLGKKLPDYMVPSAFVFLETMPLTPNGKIDRRGLPAPDASQRSVEGEFIAPRTPTEELLASIWREVLGIEQIGIDDNFFEIGGHSLLATQVISRVREAFSTEISLKQLFASPTLAEFAKGIEQSNYPLSLGVIEPVSREDYLPLSFAQERLWFLEQMEENTATYNMPGVVEVHGTLKINAFEQALQTIINRHEILRTHFDNINGSAVQIIEPKGNVTLNLVDLKALTPKEQASAIQDQIKENGQKPFNLSQTPLIRVSLLVLAEELHILLFNMHHIISDGWSMGIFIRELSELYQAFCAENPSPLKALPIQYADFAHWQRKYLSGEVLDNQLNYWKNKLANIPPLLELPTDRPHQPVQTFRGASIPIEINAQLTQKLKALSQNLQATLFMTLLASFTILLSRYSGQEDIVVGSPIANRNRAEIESLIGFFVNTLVLRTQLEGNISFEEVLKRVRQTSLDAYAHQDIPFEHLVEALQPQRNLSHSPLFQVMFVLQNAPISSLELPGITLEPIEQETAVAKFDLTLSLEEKEAGIKGVWEYNVDLFDRATLERMSQNFQTLLEAIVANPEAKITQLSLLTEEEKHQVLVEWNDTVADYAQDKCIHQLFEEQVKRTPDAVAVVYEDEQLTYQELNQQANQLAHYLQKLGVKADTLVGICVQRSLEMIVGLLGVLKAGGAYVPIDPNYPRERIEYMLKDSGVSVLLTQKNLGEDLPSDHLRMIGLDQDWEVIAQESQNNVDSDVNCEHLAYVIYTSGSTGQPKGVMIEHKGLCNLAQAQMNDYTVEPSSRLLQCVSFSFDVASSDIFMTLCAGATLYLADGDILLKGVDLIEILSNLEITHLQIPVAVLGILPFKELPSLKTIVVGGEACSAEVVSKWSKVCRFFNAYGPTETTVCATWTEFLESVQKPPIGRPIPNTEIYVLDRYLQPLPVGVPGELYIGGVGVARGYLNRPDLTAEKFLPNPFPSANVAHQTSKLYKTGDLVRYLPDGNLDFLGRTDNQVKIRGFRIELQEIETVLNQHPGVKEGAVIVHEDKSGDKRLVGYFVRNTETLEQNALRNFLKEKLPKYMIPSALILLESMPLNANGKIDRHGLPTPESLQGGQSDFLAPQTLTEKELAQIWSNILGLEKVGKHDDFFELGGHSLLAPQIVAGIEEQFSVELPLRYLFEFSTLAEVAHTIDQIRQGNTLEQKLIIDLNAEAVLDETIQPGTVPFEFVAIPNHIFLTGATGFLGAYLLNDLLQLTQADIYCLVRCSTVKEGEQRIKRKLESYELWNPDFEARIIPIPGDLSQPKLGLSDKNFSHLATQIDVIYHNGAWVNFTYPYSRLKAANVGGTEEVLRLASHSKRKPVHCVSTLSVFSAPIYAQAKLVKESEPLLYGPEGDHGYSQSKWVAEKLAMIARQRGLPVSIYRPARVTGHSQTGVSNTDDYFSRTIKGCIQLGMVPPLNNATDNLTPVDFVSRAIVYLSLQKDCLGKNFHLANPDYLYLSDLVNIVRDRGYSIQEVPYKEWRDTLVSQAETSMDNALHPLLSMFPEEVQAEPVDDSEDFLQFDCQNALDGLANSPVVCPAPDQSLLTTYLDYILRDF